MTAETVSVSWMQQELTRRSAARRRERQRSILATIGALAPNARITVPQNELDAFDNAILHHAFQLAQVAVRARDADQARRAVRLWQDRHRLREQAISTAVGPVLVVRAADCIAVNDDRLGSQMYLLNPSVSVDPAERERMAAILNTSIGTALAVGCDVLRSSTAVVIWTEMRELSETCRSYTFDFLPCTVVLNWTDEPLRLGETLVHEATHSWLNECLEAENVVFPEAPKFYSPWKDEDRPAFGIVHAAMAFANVIQYLSNVQPAPDDASYLASVLRQRLSDEQGSLQIGYQAASQCIDLVDSERLRPYLKAAVEQARQAAH